MNLKQKKPLLKKFLKEELDQNKVTKINHTRQLLGQWKFNKLVDKVLLERLVEELQRSRIEYQDVRDSIIKQDFKVNEKSTYVVPNFMGGEIVISLPQHDFEVKSFYKIGTNKEKREDMAKDFAVSNYLHSKNMPVPAVVFRTADFTATEFVQEEDLQKVLKEDSNAKFKKRVLKNTLDSVFRWHQLDYTHIKKELEVKPIEDYYGIHRFMEAVNYEGDSQSFQERWRESIDDFLGKQPQGIIHNDLHNGNVKVNENSGRVKFIDWGDASIGAVHYDMARALMSQGFYSQLESEDSLNYSKELSFVLSRKKIEDQGYLRDEFHSSLERAHTSIRLRMAKSVYKAVKKIEKNKDLEEVTTEEDREMMQGFSSYHYTMAINSLEREGLNDLVNDLELIVADSDMQRMDSQHMSEFIAKYNPDVKAWARIQSLEKLVGRSDEYQQDINQNITKISKWRSIKKKAVAIISATAITVGSIWGYKEKFEPQREQLRNEQAVVETLAKGWKPNLNSQILLIGEYKKSQLSKKGKPFLSPRIVDKVTSSLLGYLLETNPEETTKLHGIFNKFVKDSPSIEQRFDTHDCLQNEDKRMVCYRINEVSKEELVRKRKELINKQPSNFVNRGSLPQLVSPIAYYGLLDLNESIKNLDFIYFGLQGIVGSLHSELDSKKFTDILNVAAEDVGYLGNNDLFKAHILAHTLQNLILEKGSIPEAFVSLTCDQDERVLAKQNLQSLLMNKSIPCGDEALRSYLSFMYQNGITPDTFQRIVDLGGINQLESISKMKLLGKDYPDLVNIISKREIEEALYKSTRLKQNAFIAGSEAQLTGLKNMQTILKHPEGTECYDFIEEILDNNDTVLSNYCTGSFASINRIHEGLLEISEVGLRMKEVQEKKKAVNHALNLSLPYTSKTIGLYENIYSSAFLVMRVVNVYEKNFTDSITHLLDGKPYSEPSQFNECHNRLNSIQINCVTTGILPVEDYRMYLHDLNEARNSLITYKNLINPIFKDILENPEGENGG